MDNRFHRDPCSNRRTISAPAAAGVLAGAELAGGAGGCDPEAASASVSSIA
jgi:hypothetical protein